MKDVFDILNRFHPPHVLDIATGRGEFISILKQKLGSFKSVIGVDPSGKNVDYAQKIYPEDEIEIYRMELEELRFADASFDMVTISNSLHHLEARDRVFSEMLRVIKPGALFLITEMYKDGDQTPAQQSHILLHHWLAAVDRRFGLVHDQTFTKAEIISMAEGLNLANLETLDFYLPVENPHDAAYCQSLKKLCIANIKRLETLEDIQELVTEGEALIRRLEQIGCAGASRLLIWGTKPN